MPQWISCFQNTDSYTLKHVVFKIALGVNLYLWSEILLLIFFSVYHVSCEPLRIFRKDDTTCSTWVPCVLPTTGWIPGFSACSGQHAWHSCRAGCIVIPENPQRLATHMVHSQFLRWDFSYLWSILEAFIMIQTLIFYKVAMFTPP